MNQPITFSFSTSYITIIFNHINVKEDIIAKEELLQKKFKCKDENALERCEIIVNKLTPLDLNT